MKPYLRLLLAPLLAMEWLADGELQAADPHSPFPPSFGPIADADPTVREEREVLVPAGFQAARTADMLAVCEYAVPLKPTKLMVGHKMVLGTSKKLYIYPEDTERPAGPLMEGEDSGTPHKVSNIARFYPSEPFGFLQRGRPYVVEWEIAIFETDLPSQHMWMPQGGKNYKVLWQNTFRQIPKEESEFPPEIREFQAQMNRIKAQPVPPPDIPDAFLRTESEAWKRILATEITAGFTYAPLKSVVGYLGTQSHADIALKVNGTDPAKLRSIFRGFERAPLREALYWISRDTGLTAEWEIEQGLPVRILITEKKQ